MKWKGIGELTKALQRKSETDFEKVRNKSLLEMRDRSVSTREPSRGGTPVGQYKGGGQLRLSAGVNLSRGIVGYTKDYAPHVEYGHRLVRGGKQIGYVSGQKFLGTNVRIQNPIYRSDLEKEMKK